MPQKLAISMLGGSPNQNQQDLFRPLLSSFLNPQQDLVLLAKAIDWSYFEQEFSKYYAHTGKPSMPVRLLVGVHILKHLYHLGDETLVKEWEMNPYISNSQCKNA